MKKICVLGLGYIGLPTATMFAMSGHAVVGVDVNPRVVEVLNAGDIHIEEPGLHDMAQSALRSGNLTIKNKPEPSDIFIIAVPTPLVPEDNSDGSLSSVVKGKRADISYVRAAAAALAPHLKRGNLVILESTSPPGTTARSLVEVLEATGLRAGPDFLVAHCPERVLPGRILNELVNNDRVIGGIDSASAEAARDIYASFVKGQIFLTDATTAEMVKLMENTYRDVNIALANELAKLAETIDIDVWHAIKLANRHPRVNIHSPGPGVGGHCIAVDPWFIVEAAPETTPLIRTARGVNDAMPEHVVDLVKQATDGIEQPAIACLGLAYKANVDDLRESPSLEIIHLLEQNGMRVRAYDPFVREKTSKIHCQVDNLEEAINNVDCLVILTDHDEFKQLTPHRITGTAGRSIVDTRNAIDMDSWCEAGFRVHRLGTSQQAKARAGQWS